MYAKMKEFGPVGGGGHAQRTPPRSANEYVLRLGGQMVKYVFRWHTNTTIPSILNFTAILAIAKVSKGFI